MHNLKKAKALVKNMLGFYLSEDTHRSGSVSFGGVEPVHIAPGHSLHWHPITRDDEWQVNMKDIAVDGKRLHLCDSHKDGVCAAVVDTGSSLITGPSGEIDKLLTQIRTPEDCSNMGKLPQISVIMTDKDGHDISYPLTAEEYTLRSWDEIPNTGDNGYFKEFPFLGHGKEPEIKPHCEPGIGIMDVPGKKWVLGDTLLRRYYSIYDDDNGMVGFVRSLHPDETPPNAAGAAAGLESAAGAAAKATGSETVAQAGMGGPLCFVAGIVECQRAASRRQRSAQQRVDVSTPRRHLVWTMFL